MPDDPSDDDFDPQQAARDGLRKTVACLMKNLNSNGENDGTARVKAARKLLGLMKMSATAPLVRKHLKTIYERMELEADTGKSNPSTDASGLLIQIAECAKIPGAPAKVIIEIIERPPGENITSINDA